MEDRAAGERGEGACSICTATIDHAACFDANTAGANIDQHSDVDDVYLSFI